MLQTERKTRIGLGYYDEVIFGLKNRTLISTETPNFKKIIRRTVSYFVKQVNRVLDKIQDPKFSNSMDSFTFLSLDKYVENLIILINNVPNFNHVVNKKIQQKIIIILSNSGNLMAEESLAILNAK